MEELDGATLDVIPPGTVQARSGDGENLPSKEGLVESFLDNQSQRSV